MTDSPSDVQVTRNDEEGRYEIHVGDALGGFSEFDDEGDGRVVFPHTETDSAFEGQGLGTTLVAEAMKDIASRGETVVPVCSFVRHYLKKNDVPGLTVEWPDRVPSAG